MYKSLVRARDLRLSERRGLLFRSQSGNYYNIIIFYTVGHRLRDSVSDCGILTDFTVFSLLIGCAFVIKVCVPVVDGTDDVDLLDDDLEKRRYTESGPTVGPESLILWRQCLRPPCGGIDPERDREDVRLRYGYDDDNNEDATGGVSNEDRAYVAVGPWPRRRRRGQCATAMVDDDDYADDVDGSSTTVWPSVVRHCLPNGRGIDKHLQQPHRRRRAGACGRLRITLDPARLRRGTRVSAICHSLRRLLARAWVWDDEDGLQSHSEDENQDRKNRVYVMCEAVPTEDRRRRRRRVTVRVTVVCIMNF